MHGSFQLETLQSVSYPDPGPSPKRTLALALALIVIRILPASGLWLYSLWLYLLGERGDALHVQRACR